MPALVNASMSSMWVKTGDHLPGHAGQFWPVYSRNAVIWHRQCWPPEFAGIPGVSLLDERNEYCVDGCVHFEKKTVYRQAVIRGSTNSGSL